MKTLVVRAEWDAEGGMWVADSDDVPGLVTEAPTLDALAERALAAIPELLQENRPDLAGDEVMVSIRAERGQLLRVA